MQDIINLRHPLMRLAEQLNWEKVDSGAGGSRLRIDIALCAL
jgi:hypothetical protein